MKLARKIVFIINPVSGTSQNKPGAEFLRSFFKEDEFEVDVLESKIPGHATSLANDGVNSGANVIIAVGGDGTVNEIARSLHNTNCALGIIPCGSGNGLARHHHISMNVKEAIQIIKQNNVVSHDAASINGQLSFNVSGIGFDAHVAHLFGNNGKRGFNNYVKLVFQEFARYQEQEINVSSKNGNVKQSVFLTAIATASQFGNNAVISPLSNTNDGHTNLTLVRKMSGWQLPSFMYKVFTKQVGKSEFTKQLQDEKFIIECENEMPLHLDGEPAGYHKKFVVETIKGALKLIVP